MKTIALLFCLMVAVSGCATASHKFGAATMSGNQYGDDPVLLGVAIGIDVLTFLVTSIDLPSGSEPWRCNVDECKFETEDFDELKMHWASKHPEKYDEQGYVRVGLYKEADDGQNDTEEESDWQCPEDGCYFMTSDYELLKRHWALIHPETFDEEGYRRDATEDENSFFYP